MVYERQIWRDYNEAENETQNIEKGAVATSERMNNIENELYNSSVKSEDLQRQIRNTQNGMLGEYYSVADLYKAYPIGSMGFAVVYHIEGTELVGYTYTYQKASWVKGEVFRGSGIANGSITREKYGTESVSTRALELYSVTIDRIAPNSVSESKVLNKSIPPEKTTFIDVVSFNKINPDLRGIKKALNNSGSLADNVEFYTTGYIITKKGDKWVSSQTIQSYSFYDETKKFEKSVLNFGGKEFTSDVDGYIRVTYYSADGGVSNFKAMITNSGYLPAEYETYKESIKNRFVEKLKAITFCEVLPSGKNLLDVSKATSNKRLNRFGDLVTVTTDFKVSDLGFIKSDLNYTASSVSEVIFYDEYGKVITGSLVTNNVDATWTFKTPSAAKYFRATFGGTGEWGQIEEGLKYTGYEKIKYALFNEGRNIQTLAGDDKLFPVLDKDPEFPQSGQIWIRG